MKSQTIFFFFKSTYNTQVQPEPESDETTTSSGTRAGCHQRRIYPWGEAIPPGQGLSHRREWDLLLPAEPGALRGGTAHTDPISAPIGGNSHLHLRPEDFESKDLCSVSHPRQKHSHNHGKNHQVPCVVAPGQEVWESATLLIPPPLALTESRSFPYQAAGLQHIPGML